MKINLNEIDQTQFLVKPYFVNGETLWLVGPQMMGCEWTQANKHLRSSLWTDDGELVSAGFPKFTNWGEKPEHFPVPKSLKGCTVMEKLDGSLLIVTKYKGNYIIRTRGTVDATQLDNGHEIELFKQKYQAALDGLLHSDPDTWQFSLLFEWVSPINRIILNYGDQPEWYLVGGVNHQNYTLWSQAFLDDTASRCLKCPRPPAYTFPSIEALMKDVEQWKGKEGVVIYSGEGQVPHKAKGLWYLALHRMKEALASIDKVIDVWSDNGEPSFPEFERFIVDRFDWELWTQIRGEASRICDASKGVKQIMDGMQRFVNEKLLPLGDPKDKKTRGKMASLVISAYGNTNRASYVFKLLDGKPLDSEDRKKLLYQVLKK